MEKLDIGPVIHHAISRFSQNRLGAMPSIFVTLAPAMPQVPWKDSSAGDFVRRFIYQTLLTSDSDTPIEISLKRRSYLNDLNAFLGIKPSYWIQLRVTGRGIRVGEQLINDLFDELGFRIEEWVGVQGSKTRLGIFATIDAPKLTMVFCLESVRHKLRCDLLLPVDENGTTPAVRSRAGKRSGPDLIGCSSAFHRALIMTR